MTLSAECHADGRYADAQQLVDADAPAGECIGFPAINMGSGCSRLRRRSYVQQAYSQSYRCAHYKTAQELEDADAPAGECIGFAAAMCCLRGAAFEALDNAARAASCFSAALRADPFCYEAFQVRSR